MMNGNTGRKIGNIPFIASVPIAEKKAKCCDVRTTQ